MYSSTRTEYEDNEGRKSAQSRAKNGTNSIPYQPPEENVPADQPLIWLNVFGIAMLHAVSIYIFLIKYNQAKFWTWVFHVVYGCMAGIGITAGLHRLWAHKSYKAKLPLRIILMFLYCSTGQHHPSKWIRTHRTHHKYTDTSADPHNAKRGFFFSHFGWLMMKHHPAVKEYGKYVNVSDLSKDPVIRFADKYFPMLMTIQTFIIPTLIPIYGWNESWFIGIGATFFRYMWILNASCSVNSVTHLWGYRPYNRNINPTENYVVSIFAVGEGWHNYHHCFPWDYKASEYGRFNPTTTIINFMAWLGWAYDLKTPGDEIVNRWCANKGDGTPCPMTKGQSQNE